MASITASDDTADHEAQLLARLGSDAAWPVLRDRVKRRMDSEFDRLARELMRGEQPDNTVVAYRRGVFAGMKFILDCPTLEAKKLDRALQRKDEVIEVA